MILREANKLSTKNPDLSKSSYRPVHHILPTSDIVERLFSVAKLYCFTSLIKQHQDGSCIPEEQVLEGQQCAYLSSRLIKA
jgi:hypothetical protein